ncbi:hypothetical protein J6590_094466 [Homalodisca vitripennis]|nr:hypothetical protein J6590_094466 [Homalodisca vitripennis]
MHGTTDLTTILLPSKALRLFQLFAIRVKSVETCIRVEPLLVLLQVTYNSVREQHGLSRIELCDDKYVCWELTAIINSETNNGDYEVFEIHPINNLSYISAGDYEREIAECTSEEEAA